MIITKTAGSKFSAVGAGSAELTAGLASNKTYVLVSSTAAYIKQAAPVWTVTVVAKASLADTDFFTITYAGVAYVFEFDTAGDGVTAGRVQVNVSGDTTAAQVAARLKTAIDGSLGVQPNQPQRVKIIDNADGTLTVTSPEPMTMTENVTNAGFTVVQATNTASGADDNVIVPASMPTYLDGRHGARVAIIQVAAGGNATISEVVRSGAD